MPRRLVVIVAAVMIVASGLLGARGQQRVSDLGRSAESPTTSPQHASAAAQAVDRAAKDAIQTLQLQTEMPKDDAGRFRIPVPEELIWVLIACLVLFLLYALRDSLPFWRRNGDRGWEMPSEAAGDAARAGGVDALAAADTLSRQGRFVEAMHMLLLQSLTEIRQQLGEQFADSLTSREILRGVRLPPQGRTSLRDIVAAVERTYFGGYPAAPDDYAACRQSFDSLRLAMRGGAAP